MPGDCRNANRARWRGWRRRVLVEHCDRLTIGELLHGAPPARAPPPPAVETTRILAGNGARTPYFLCPSCGRRCGILHRLRAPGACWGCRVCLRLAYWRQRSSNAKHRRAFRALLATVADSPRGSG